MDFQTFLKKTSSIPNSYIDDLFSMYDYKTLNSDFVIDLDKVAKWLSAKKSELLATLKRSYTQRTDYKQVGKEMTKGRPKTIILLTPECFKRICMQSRTAKADQVRTYFIEAESLLFRYKDAIIEHLQKQVGTLKLNQAPVPTPSKGVIYILKTPNGPDDMFKIGKTKAFKERMRSHQAAMPDNVEVSWVFETEFMDQVETCLKLAIKPRGYRKRKEIYQIDLDTLKEVIKTCERAMLKGRALPKRKKQQDGGAEPVYYYAFLDREEGA